MTHEFHEGLVTIGADIALGIDDLAEGFTELHKLLLCALPWKIAKMEDFRRGLSVSELRLPGGGHRSGCYE